MKLNKAISPILATVILIAVTLVIAIGVIGWIMGIWGSFGATETLQVYPDSFIDSDKKTLTLHVKNTGSATAVIYRIEIVGLHTVTSDFNFSTGTTTTSTGSEVSLPPGQEGYIVVTADNPIPGTTYQVKIYTRAGNVFTANVQAK